MMNFLKSLFETPHFPEGARVNQLATNFIAGWTSPDQIDGRVLTQTREGVLVEWPRGGLRWVSPEALCLQA
ncbi:hypothetical protein LPB72_08515 [Hydrogenophaga crassostreae]|uniref:Uncharacterized protein n=1 Tax=Hydrogenophaga crassostreae TaxID=1763535 RepID=A0A163CIF9_9BURK|nr:hypothetical protein [Hydrogenophaga crassostreae]AOW12461.1 hypothetical protein LPB072_05935 [Hydrogenophaga crassostreae]OAD42514.1 hypothetical protein LPB72_08515 [Hydrogenophaga crassostreae]